METESLQIRIHGDAGLPALIYLPGIHGDWTLVSSFRERMKPHVRFVEFTYPRTLAWSLDHYAAAVLEQLKANGIREGMILGESFGSQVAWAMLAEGRHSCRPVDPSIPAGEHSPAVGDRNVAFPFCATMLILAGGFVRYPFMPLVDFARLVWKVTPASVVRAFFEGYAIFARWRHRHAPETAGAIQEFVARRTPLDLAAMDHRLKLIRKNDPTAIARQTAIPVCQLAGFWDPIVWPPAVRRGLQQFCPGYRETRIVSRADHNVLGTAPDAAAKAVAEWIPAKVGQA
jgi:pimeloyl-ACP methyl ester carboxylesterase